jgi:hypothetical protein
MMGMRGFGRVAGVDNEKLWSVIWGSGESGNGEFAVWLVAAGAFTGSD